MFAYIPSNLDLRSEKHHDKFYFIITFIFYGRIFDKRKDSASFIQLSSVFLKRILSGHYKEYIKALIDKNIIETDNHYVVNGKFKAFRLRENYRDVKAKQVEIEDNRIVSNYRNYKIEQKGLISGSQYKYIFSCLEKVEIDYEAAKEFLNKNALTFEQYNSWNCSIDMIHHKDWFFVVDKTAGRVHNNITNLPKIFRPFLSFNGQKLIEIDLRNSQPLLFNILISRYLLRFTDYTGNILPYVPQDSDLRFYRLLTENGKFYEYMMDKTCIFEERELFKVRLFSKVFYGKENQSVEQNLFKELFPTVWEIVSYYKKVNYKNLAIELQRVEADIMINTVVLKIAEKKILALTIHDSILTTPNNVQKVKKIILSEFKKYNLQPTLKIKGL